MRALLVPLLCLAAVPALAQERAPHQVGILNQAGATIREIYIAPADAPGWGANRLVSQLPAGASASIRFTGPCQAKLRIVLDGGAADERQDADVCDGSGFAVNAGSVTVAADSPQTVAVSMPVAGAQAAPRKTPPAEVAGAVDPGQWHGHFLTKRYGGL